MSTSALYRWSCVKHRVTSLIGQVCPLCITEKDLDMNTCVKCGAKFDGSGLNSDGIEMYFCPQHRYLVPESMRDDHSDLGPDDEPRTTLYIIGKAENPPIEDLEPFGSDKHRGVAGAWEYRNGCTCLDCSMQREKQVILEELDAIRAAVEIATTPAHREDTYKAVVDLSLIMIEWLFSDYGKEHAPE